MIHNPSPEELERYAPTLRPVQAAAMWDGLGARGYCSAAQGTYSNALPAEPPTIAGTLRALAEIGAYRFRSASLEWFERAK